MEEYWNIPCPIKTIEINEKKNKYTIQKIINIIVYVDII